MSASEEIEGLEKRLEKQLEGVKEREERLKLRESIVALRLENANVAAFAVVDNIIKKVLVKKMSRGGIQHILPDMIAAAKEVLA